MILFVDLQNNKYKILIVDDHKSSIETIKAILEDIGVSLELETANDGVEALIKLKESLPQLVILDAMMPGMDGCEVVKRMRANEQLKHIKILGYTADLHEAKNFEKLGVDKVIIKGSPASDINNFQKEVRELLEVKQENK